MTNDLHRDTHQKKIRFSKLFQNTCKAFVIYLSLWGLMLVMLLIGAIFECLPAIAAFILYLIPSILRLGLILLIGAIAAISYEGFR